MKLKIIGFILLFIFLSTAGQFVGGALYFLLTNIPIENIKIDSLYRHWKIYNSNPAVLPALQGGVAVAGFFIFLPILMIVTTIINRTKEEIHGSARFANDKELTESGLFPKVNKHPPLLLGVMDKGKHKGKYVELEGQQFLGVEAPTESGKGLGIVIPNLVNYPDSLVNTDIKLENFVKTAGYRQAQGQKIYLFSPDGYATNESDREQGILRSHCWNPFFYVRRLPQYRIGDILVISETIYPLSGDGGKDIWPSSAGRLFLGLSLWMLDTEDITKQTPTIPYLISLRSVSGGITAWMQGELNQDYLSDETREEFNKFIDTHEETRSSILTTFDSPLTIFQDKVASASVSKNDFDFRDLRRKGITIYIGVQPPNLKRYQVLLNLFVEQIINENTRVLPEHDKTLVNQCLMLLDEFPALGRVNQIKTSIGYARQFNLRFLLIFQDRAQLEDKDLYGKEGAENITSNFTAEVIYPPKTVTRRVKEISDTLGTKTVRVKNHSSSDVHSSGLTRKNSRNITQQRRELMKPQEIVELGFKKHKVIPVGTKLLLLRNNQRPFIMNKIIYPFDNGINERVEYSKMNIPTIPLLTFN